MTHSLATERFTHGRIGRPPRHGARRRDVARNFPPRTLTWRPAEPRQADAETQIYRWHKRGSEMDRERGISDDDPTGLGERPKCFFHNHDDCQLLVQRIEPMRGPRDYSNRGD